MAQSWEKLKGIYDDYPELLETGRLDLDTTTAVMPYQVELPRRGHLRMVSAVSNLAMEASAGLSAPQLRLVEGGTE